MCQMLAGSVRSILHELKLYPYQIAIWLELKPPDYACWKIFCPRFNSFVRSGMAKLNTVFFSDDAWLHLDNYNNKRASCSTLDLNSCVHVSVFKCNYSQTTPKSSFLPLYRILISFTTVTAYKN